MKTAAIIAEFNPFHNGHAALLRKAREACGADYVLVVMSGDFVQRGETALVEKYTRTRMALASGADLVLELPHYVSLGSAEYFAAGAVSLCNRLGVVDTLVFGSECGDINRLRALAKILSEEPPAFQLQLQKYLKSGDNFPLARTKALAHCLPETEKDETTLLESPNNLLGIEYLKQMMKTKSRFEVLTLKRTANVSAEAIRTSLLSPHGRIRKAQMPETSAMLLADYQERSGYRFGDTGAVFPALIHLLQLENESGIVQIADVGEEIASRIYRALPASNDFESLVDAVHTKDVTRARVKRALLHILLLMPQKTYDTVLKKRTTYARVLGFRKTASPLMNRIKTAGKIPLITKLAQAEKLLAQDPGALHLLQEDIRASQIYERLFLKPAFYPMKNEYEKPLVVV